MVKFPSSSLLSFSHYSPFVSNVYKQVLKPSKEDPMSHLAKEENIFQYFFVMSIMFHYCSENLIYLSILLIAIVIHYPAFNLLSRMFFCFVFFYKWLGNPGNFLLHSLILDKTITNLNKPPIHLNPIKQISVFQRCKESLR